MMWSRPGRRVDEPVPDLDSCRRRLHAADVEIAALRVEVRTLTQQRDAARSDAAVLRHRLDGQPSAVPTPSGHELYLREKETCRRLAEIVARLEGRDRQQQLPDDGVMARAVLGDGGG